MSRTIWFLKLKLERVLNKVQKLSESRGVEVAREKMTSGLNDITDKKKSLSNKSGALELTKTSDQLETEKLGLFPAAKCDQCSKMFPTHGVSVIKLVFSSSQMIGQNKPECFS
jgi:hypothetical protein